MCYQDNSVSSIGTIAEASIQVHMDGSVLLTFGGVQTGQVCTLTKNFLVCAVWSMSFRVRSFVVANSSWAYLPMYMLC